MLHWWGIWVTHHSVHITPTPKSSSLSLQVSYLGFPLRFSWTAATGSYFISLLIVFTSLPIHFHTAAMMTILNTGIIMLFFILKPFHGFLSPVRFSLGLQPPCTLALTRLSHASGSFSANTFLLWPGFLLSSPLPCPSGLTYFLYPSWFCEPGLSGISLYFYSPHYSPFCSIYDMILQLFGTRFTSPWEHRQAACSF